MIEITTPTGAKVKINIAGFRDVMSLKSAIAKELKHSDVNISNIDMDDLSDGGSINTLIKAVLSVDSSDLVIEKLFKCLKACTYNENRITEDTFEDIEAREDYYPIAYECLKANLLPFFKGVVSKLKTSGLLEAKKENLE